MSTTESPTTVIHQLVLLLMKVTVAWDIIYWVRFLIVARAHSSHISLSLLNFYTTNGHEFWCCLFVDWRLIALLARSSCSTSTRYESITTWGLMLGKNWHLIFRCSLVCQNRINCAARSRHWIPMMVSFGALQATFLLSHIFIVWLGVFLILLNFILLHSV